jgi:hypothetical protein
MVAIINPQTQEIITAAERAAANIKLGCDAAFDAMTQAGSVTASRKAPLAKAVEYLGRCRNHYARAKAMGASPEQLSALASFGKRAAEAVAIAEARANSTEAPATKALRFARAKQLTGMNVREAARHVANALVTAGLAADAAAGIAALAAKIDPRAATVDNILVAWMALQP